MNYLISSLSVFLLSFPVPTILEASHSFKDFYLITVATNETDGYKRFITSAEKFDIPTKVLGMDTEWKGGNMLGTGGGYKVVLVRAWLEDMERQLSAQHWHRLIVMFTDAYDVLLTQGVEDILSKFQSFNSRIVFSAEPYCWPDRSLSDLYPPTESPYKYLNSGGYMGYAKDLLKLIKDHRIDNEDDDQLYFTKLYLDRTIREGYRFRLDNYAKIFQNLQGATDDVAVESNVGDYPYLVNHIVGGSRPAVIHGNGFAKQTLNSLSNYLAKAWHNTLGCLDCRPQQEDLSNELYYNLPLMQFGIFINQKTPFLQEFLEKIANLNYPKNKVNLFIYNNIVYHKGLVEEFIQNFGSKYASVKEIRPEDDINEARARFFSMENCVIKKCGYLFVMDSVTHLDNPNVVQTLLKNNKGIVAPLLMRPFKLWSNFWGSLNNEGFYARSFDYMDIINNNKRGLWNVPYISSCYLLNATLIPLLGNAFINSNLDPDMSFCKTFRDKGIFMYVDNIDDYGHLVDAEHVVNAVKHPDFYQLLHNQLDWEQRYLHENYSRNFEPERNHSQPCPDVYWFPLVSPRFCSELIDIMETFGKWSGGSNRDERLVGGYENVPTRDIHMNQVGLERMWLEFLKLYITPLQEMVFLGYHHDPPQSLMNFVVRYKPDEQPNLRPHHDSSTFTINIALNRYNDDYEGGGCRFIRYNCSVTNTKVGWVLMHPGRLTHYHEGLLVTKGTRYIMISFVDP